MSIINDQRTDKVEDRYAMEIERVERKADRRDRQVSWRGIEGKVKREQKGGRR